MVQYEVRRYVTSEGVDALHRWMKDLRDPIGLVRIVRRLNRLESGNFGDHKYCGSGVWELRIDSGPGYRVYYGVSSQTIVLLLCGGAKRTQQRDIERAHEYWKDWQKRSRTGGATVQIDRKSGARSTSR